MLASVLNTPTAIQASVLIVRAFVKLRKILSTHEELEKKKGHELAIKLGKARTNKARQAKASIVAIWF